jgi:predicted  nucleic acid-binding Zn-ribbon protein
MKWKTSAFFFSWILFHSILGVHATDKKALPEEDVTAYKELNLRVLELEFKVHEREDSSHKAHEQSQSKLKKEIEASQNKLDELERRLSTYQGDVKNLCMRLSSALDNVRKAEASIPVVASSLSWTLEVIEKRCASPKCQFFLIYVKKFWCFTNTFISLDR